MSEEKPGIVEGAAKAVAEIVKEVPVYKDAVQPVAQETGKALALPISVINTALRPIRSLLLGVNLAFDRLDERMRRRLADVPPAKIVEPPAAVAGPLLMAYAFAESEPSLREMFEQLLATSMISDTREKAHPSYVEIIRQLSAEEARLLAEITQRGIPRKTPIVRIDAHDQQNGGHTPVIPVTDLTAVHITRFPACSGNLERLGLIEVTFDEFLVGAGVYDALESNPDVVAIKNHLQSIGRPTTLSHGFLSLTPFGREFVQACVAMPPTSTPQQGEQPTA